MPARKNSNNAQKKKRVIRKKVTKNTAATPAPAPEPEPAPVVQETQTVAEVEPVTTVTESSVETVSPAEKLEHEFTSILTRLHDLRSLQQSLVSDVKRLQKNVTRFLKDASKKRRSKVSDPNKPKRAPSGFAKPALISSQLCSFLGVKDGTEMARTEVTKYLTEYIKTHQLQDKNNRRKIIPNKELQKLLNVNSSDDVTYFNLQKYMKVHFPKTQTSSTA